MHRNLLAVACASLWLALPCGCRERQSASPGAPPRAASVAERLVAPQPARSVAPPATRVGAADALLPEASIWSSRQACERALGQGQRAPRSPGSARIGTWNVRWYPDGRPGRKANDSGGTDIAWLACAIAWLNVDALAVQEFKAHDRARQRSAELVAALDRHTRGHWKLVLDDCRGGDAGQHVGILYDSSKVSAGEPIVLATLNPHGRACKDQLRPGLALALSFAGGLDLYLVSVHLKSGPERRSFDLRARSLAGLPEAVRELQRRKNETDVVIAGDINTMGCRRCSPPIPASDEIESVSKQLAALVPAFRRVEPSQPCSEYYADGAGLLDHFLVSSVTREVSASARTMVSGFCGEAACARIPSKSQPSVNAAISDHCPLVLELSDRDLD